MASKKDSSKPLRFSKGKDERNSVILMPSDKDALVDTHRFVRNNEEDHNLIESEGWKIRMARKYYNRLYKEYAIVDLTHYERNQIGMRWRVEKEVIR